MSVRGRAVTDERFAQEGDFLSTDGAVGKDIRIEELSRRRRRSGPWRRKEAGASR